MFFEKSPQIEGAQRRAVEARKAGNRELAFWWMHVARDNKQREAAQWGSFYDDMEGIWWNRSQSTRYVNG